MVEPRTLQIGARVADRSGPDTVEVHIQGVTAGHARTRPAVRQRFDTGLVDLECEQPPQLAFAGGDERVRTHPGTGAERLHPEQPPAVRRRTRLQRVARGFGRPHSPASPVGPRRQVACPLRVEFGEDRDSVGVPFDEPGQGQVLLRPSRERFPSGAGPTAAGQRQIQVAAGRHSCERLGDARTVLHRTRDTRTVLHRTRTRTRTGLRALARHGAHRAPSP